MRKKRWPLDFARIAWRHIYGDFEVEDALQDELASGDSVFGF